MQRSELKELRFPYETIWLFVGSLFLGLTIAVRGGEQCPIASKLLCEMVPFLPLPVIISTFGLLISLFLFFHNRRANANLKLIYDEIEKYRNDIYRGLATTQGDALRILHYRESAGSLVNTTAADSRNAPRNVLLNNKTIQTILKNVRDEGEDVLEKVGYDCGFDFGNVVVALHRGRLDDLNSLIEEWFRYDSNSGFGRFEASQILRTSSGPEIRITLHHSFLTAGSIYRHPDASLCAFMRGYIRGVFCSLPLSTLRDWNLDPAQLRVLHSSTGMECVCMSGNDDAGCTFTVVASR